GVEIRTLGEQLAPEGRGAKRRSRTFEGMDEGTTLLALDPLGKCKCLVHIVRQNRFSPELAAAAHAEGVGGLWHHDLGAGARRLRRPRNCNRVVAGADCRHTTRQRGRLEALDAVERAASLEAAGVLEKLQLEEDRGVGR